MKGLWIVEKFTLSSDSDQTRPKDVYAWGVRTVLSQKKVLRAPNFWKHNNRRRVIYKNIGSIRNEDLLVIEVLQRTKI